VVLVNGHTLEDYFGKRPAVHLRVIQPLISADVKERYDILCKAEGGGKIGQADAIRMGIARSLAELNPEFALLMRREGFLTRDSREKESKKYGRKKARKRFQFSKR
jgi:small subunit ribosomal protein S9